LTARAQRQPASNYLGSLTAYCAEVADPANMADAADTLWHEAFSDLVPVSFSTDVGELRWGGAIRAMGAALVYRRGDKRAHGPFLWTLPQMCLCGLKVSNAVENIGADLTEARRAEESIAGILEGKPVAKLDLDDVRERIDRLSAAKARLAECLVRVEWELRTIRLNRRNFQMALRHTPWAGQVKRLQHHLIDQTGQYIQLQAAADLGYRNAATKRAEAHLESLEATASYYEVVETRKLSRIVLALTAIQVTSLLPTIFNFTQLPWYLKATYIGATALVLAAPAIWWLTYRRK
jgi:hypothetical protein